MAGENDDNFRVDSVFQNKQIAHHDTAERTGEREGRREEKKRQKRRPQDYFETLAKRAEVSNKELEKKNLPYRFCVYLKGDQVYIDLVTLDNAGKIAKTVRRNITDEDFDKWIEDMSSLEGMFFDQNA